MLKKSNATSSRFISIVYILFKIQNTYTKIHVAAFGKKTTLEPISFQSTAVSLDAKLAASQRQARHEGR